MKITLLERKKCKTIYFKCNINNLVIYNKYDVYKSIFFLYAFNKEYKSVSPDQVRNVCVNKIS